MAASQSGTIRYAPFNISTATTTTLVAAVTGKSIDVIHFCFSMTGTTPTAKVQDDAGSPNVLTGTFDLAGVYAFNGRREDPLFSTAKGQALTLVSTGTPSIRGFVAYKQGD